MKMLGRFTFMNLLLALFVSGAALSAFADPPSRAVRLQYISGAVSIQPGGVNDWVEAVVNRPLTTADRVWTDKQARAELHLGSAALRVSSETSLTLTNVSDDIVQIELDQGTLNLHLRHQFGGETYEIDTPNQAFTILKAGDYRFDVDPNADTTSVTVWRGEGEANGQGPGVTVHSGQQASFTGGTSMQHQVASAPGLDGFDDWCRVRDDREDHAQSYQYVSADVVGAADLDEYGTWQTTGEYGAVWVPRVAPGWAPYHYGHWVWIEPWGWTWVDDEPWGFAPSHYGRWVHLGAFWAWAPGPVVVARPVYAPALVAWVGGPQFGVSVSFGGGGGVGWFPLGWGEPYVPAYQVSRTYFQQVNVTNTHITNITNVTNNYYVTNNNTTVVQNNIQNIHYANRTVAGAVTAVPTRAMTNSEPVAKAAVSVRANDIQAGSFTTGAAIAPARSSVLGARAGAPAVMPPARGTMRPVVSHSAPPPKPVPFEAKQEMLARNPGRPLDSQTESELRSRFVRESQVAPSRTNAPPSNQQPVQSGRSGMPTMTTPSAAESKPAMQPTGNGQPPQGNTSGRFVPRPPQPGIQPGSTNPAPSANATPAANSMPAGRPMPSVNPNTPPNPAPSANSTPGANPGPGRSPMPGASPTSAANPLPGANSVRPVPRPPQVERTGNGDMQRPNSDTPRPTADMPRPMAPPASRPRPTVPAADSATSNASPTPQGEPNRSMERSAPAPTPRPVAVPSADSARPDMPRPSQNQTRPTVQRTSQETLPRPQAGPRPQSPRPAAESHPQQSHSQSTPGHQESKGEGKNEGK